MRPWDWLSLIEEAAENSKSNVGVAASLPTLAVNEEGRAAATLDNRVNPAKAANKQVNRRYTIKLMTDLEIREFAKKQKPSYFARLKKKAYEKQLCSKEGHFWAMLERLSQEFAKKKPNEFDLQLWTKFVKYAQRDWEIEKLQSSLNAKCPVCGSKDFEFAEKGQEKGFVCLSCLKATGRVEFVACVSIENDVPEWKDRITLGTGKLIPNGFCTRCGETFKWLAATDFEGWICKGCGEEFL
jgi:DNA-directed RNA polymerase subunit RPC12/RpoP